jgi:hypothetical protein
MALIGTPGRRSVLFAGSGCPSHAMVVTARKLLIASVRFFITVSSHDQA